MFSVSDKRNGVILILLIKSRQLSACVVGEGSRNPKSFYPVCVCHAFNMVHDELTHLCLVEMLQVLGSTRKPLLNWG